jgi:hypothetical protein
MNADEFYKMRANKAIPHDDELCFDAHDRTPDRTAASSQPSRWMVAAMLLVIPVLLVLIYIWEILT